MRTAHLVIACDKREAFAHGNACDDLSAEASQRRRKQSIRSARMGKFLGSPDTYNFQREHGKFTLYGRTSQAG